jgi:hypothetical protein
MLQALFGSIKKDRVLLFLYTRDEGYAREIARFFNYDLYSVQNYLEKLELGGVIYGRKAGRTRLYAFNTRWLFINELKTLLKKVLSSYPDEIRDALEVVRRRPRRKEKPL